MGFNMNERIKQLTIQAGGGPSKWYTDPNVLQEFAELIVRECAGVNYNSAFKDGEFCAREVLEHFGVEE